MENKKLMKLDRICDSVIEIEEGLMYGTISFFYDNLMSAMKVGHPMEILDDILSHIFFDVKAGTIPELDQVKYVLSEFIEFRTAFKVKELTPVIKKLKDYIRKEEEAESATTQS